jgi:hypothetical protein
MGDRHGPGGPAARRQSDAGVRLRERRSVRRLPPALGRTDEHGDAEFRRAVVFVTDDTEKGTSRSGQEYVSPLLVLTGEEYATMTFDVLLEQLGEAIRSGPRVVAEYVDVEGETPVLTEDDVEGTGNGA